MKSNPVIDPRKDVFPNEYLWFFRSKAANYASTKAKQKTLFAFVVLEFKL